MLAHLRTYKRHYNKFYCGFFDKRCVLGFLLLLLRVLLLNLINFIAITHYHYLHFIKIFSSDTMYVKFMAYTVQIFYNIHRANIPYKSARPPFLILITYYHPNNLLLVFDFFVK